MPLAASAPRRRAALAAATTFALGLGVLVYRGPGQAFVRGTLGDVLVTACLYSLAFALGWRGRLTRVISIAALAAGLELLQWAGRAPTDDGGLVATALGTTFDAWDLVAEAAGLTAAVALEARAGAALARRSP